MKQFQFILEVNLNNTAKVHLLKILIIVYIIQFYTLMGKRQPEKPMCLRFGPYNIGDVTRLNLSIQKQKQQFVNATKGLLLKLAAQRKSLKTEARLRETWAKTQGDNISQISVQIIEDPKIYRYESNSSLASSSSNVIVIDQEQVEEQAQQAQQAQKEAEGQQQQKRNEPTIHFQLRPKKKIKLYFQQLRTLIGLFIQELQHPYYNCICGQILLQQNGKCRCQRPTKVHRIVEENIDIKQQIDRLKEMLQNGENFNEDRILNLYKNSKAMPWMFAKEMITAFEHRALCLLLKRINNHKYSLSFSENQNTNRNSILQHFYLEQHSNPVQDYYKELLKIEIQFKRYLSHPHEKSKVMIGLSNQSYSASNFMRKLLNLVFSDKIKGKPENKLNIDKLETQISTSIIAEVLLKQMRKIQPISQAIQDKSKQQNQKIQNNVCLKEQQHKQRSVYKAGKAVTQEQRMAIERTLQGHRKNRRHVPYPYCLFLQYRLRAQPPTHYTNPNNPSSDQEEGYQQAKQRQRLKELNVYRGYRGYKTQNKIVETRKMRKGIMRGVDQMANYQQFELGTLTREERVNENQVENRCQQKEVVKPDLHDGEIMKVPFPFNLSIFEEDKQKYEERMGKKPQ